MKGYTELNQDDSYTILINARLSFESQLKVYAHELSHITNDDLYKNDADIVEFLSHKIS